MNRLEWFLFKIGRLISLTASIHKSKKIVAKMQAEKDMLAKRKLSDKHRKTLNDGMDMVIKTYSRNANQLVQLRTIVYEAGNLEQLRVALDKCQPTETVDFGNLSETLKGIQIDEIETEIDNIIHGRGLL